MDDAIDDEYLQNWGDQTKINMRKKIKKENDENDELVKQRPEGNCFPKERQIGHYQPSPFPLFSLFIFLKKENNNYYY